MTEMATRAKSARLFFVLAWMIRPVWTLAQTTAPSNVIRTSTHSPAASTSTDSLDTFRVLGALLLVLAAILVCRLLLRRFLRLPTGRSSELIHVLSRTALSPRQHILVIQVPGRILVVADTGQQLTTLCQITDPDEIRAFTGPTDDEPATEVPEPDQESGLSSTRREVRTLLQKVRGLSQQFR